MKVGDDVRVKHPTGGIMAHHRFVVEQIDPDPDGWVIIRGDIGGRSGQRPYKFHRSSLEVVNDVPVGERSGNVGLGDSDGYGR